ncbi:MAG TPA: hypothetical protein VLH12_07235 [Usitatibacter sp.]|nr:hypothetical protein [Usitatibacter sp.]
MIFLRRPFAALIAWFAIPAFATPQPIDATGLWMNPAESGWGISVFHQGDTLFASLFVYGPDGQPKWYTASGMAGGPATYSGALVEATGPYFGASSFDSNAVTRRIVGTMTLALDDTSANVTYTVDGTQVSKRVQRFSMRPLNLSGAYFAVELQPASVSGTEIVRLDQHLQISDNGTAMTMSSDSNSTSACTFDVSSRTQNGETVTASGTYHCGGSSGPFSMTVDPTPHGFAGTFTGNGITQGRIAAALRTPPKMQGNGWLDDLWFPWNEGGWGLNLIDQGDTAFATLFVYDAQNRPHWYSASQLTAGMQSDRVAWSGSLEESTGPYFGAPFDPSRVSRQVVGNMSLSIAPNENAFLTYTVNGLTISKEAGRFAFRWQNLTGSYRGHVVMRTDDPRGLSYDDAQITIDDHGDDTMSMSIDIATGPKCNFTGRGPQFGKQREVSGTYTCQDGTQGLWVMNDVMVTAAGFTGTYSGPAGHIGGRITNGHISGARR